MHVISRGLVSNKRFSNWFGTIPPLRTQGLVTEREPIVMPTGDGTIVEIFVWVSQAAIAGAHKNPAVLDLWKRFESVCSYETPSNIAEFHNMFAHFERL